jgi:hypothetical protein
MECTFGFHKSPMAIRCFVGVAPDTLENIQPGFYKIGNVVVVHTLEFTSWLFIFGAGVLLNRVRICIEEGHIKPKRC